MEHVRLIFFLQVRTFGYYSLIMFLKLGWILTCLALFSKSIISAACYQQHIAVRTVAFDGFYDAIPL